MSESVTGRTRTLRVGTRGSALALAQANMVVGRLRAAHPGFDFSITIVKTEGDVDKTSPLTEIGGRGVFTSALQHRLLDGSIDLAVHSAKDVPSLSPAGLTLAGFPDREDPRDALISRHGVGIASLPERPVIGTSSRRRAAQIQAIRPDAVIRELRGNIDTRLKKAQGDAYDAIVLAVAGITRMGWADAITEILDVECFTPAPAQGAIAIETRDEPDLAAIVDAISQPAIAHAVAIERAFLRGVGGGCTTPIGAYAVADGDGFRLDAMLAEDDGLRITRRRVHVRSDDEAFDLARVMQGSLPSGVSERPLVLTTGSARQQENLGTALAVIGTDVLHLETFRIEATGIKAKLPQAEWLVITSGNAFPYASEIAMAQQRGGAQLAVIGAATRAAAESAGLRVDLVGSRDGASLASDLGAIASRGAMVVCLVADNARPETAAGLHAAGLQVSVVPVYRNVPAETVPEDVLAAVADGRVTAVTFASPSAVTSFMGLLGEALGSLSSAAYVAIGETTAAAMRDIDLPVHDVAVSPTAAGLADAVRRAVGM